MNYLEICFHGMPDVTRRFHWTFLLGVPMVAGLLGTVTPAFAATNPITYGTSGLSQR